VFFSKDLKAKLDFIREAGFEAAIPPGMKFPPNRHDVNMSRKEYLDLAYSLSDFVKRNYFLAESIVVFKDIVNDLLIGKSININERGAIGIQLDDGTSLPLNRLSSGEKQIFVMLDRLLFHAAPGSVVLIDEPEISLHVSWQQTIGSTFMDIARLRDLQIVVATHSPQIIHDKWDLTNELRADRA
jgi:ABC-type lipoprotein export system ATPase subunit